jgi:outer membrane receptor protein involved in Fe transport
VNRATLAVAVVATTSLFTSSIAAAQPATPPTAPTGAAAPQPLPPGPEAVDPGDLPPLPIAVEEPTSSATVLAAASVEEDVVVGAAKREQSLGNVASAVTVISGDRLRRFGYRTVGEAVGAVAGVYLNDNRLTYAIGIRGLSIPGDFNTRILVLVDGASVNEAWGSFAGLGYDNFVSIDDIARIELIRGPVGSVYGANAFFGIVNIVTRAASETPRLWGRTSINSINGVVASAGFSNGDVHRQLRGTIQVMDRFGETVYVPGISDSTGEIGRAHV